MSSVVTPSIAELAEQRQITEILHFTTNLGFLGSLAAGRLLPRNKLRQERILEHIMFPNSSARAEESDAFDKTENWIDYVNMSISEITTNLFRASVKWHTDKDISWIIMAFDPEILSHDGVYFSTTNNIYPRTKRGSGSTGFSALFAPVVPRRGTWSAYRGARASFLTTCEQAEVLYPQGVSMTYLRKVYVREGEDADWAHASLATYNRSDVTVAVEPSKFLGKPN